VIRRADRPNYDAHMMAELTAADAVNARAVAAVEHVLRSVHPHRTTFSRSELFDILLDVRQGVARS
jgi:hypothetical protein